MATAMALRHDPWSCYVVFYGVGPVGTCVYVVRAVFVVVQNHLAQDSFEHCSVQNYLAQDGFEHCSVQNYLAQDKFEHLVFKLSCAR